MLVSSTQLFTFEIVKLSASRRKSRAVFFQDTPPLCSLCQLTTQCFSATHGTKPEGSRSLADAIRVRSASKVFSELLTGHRPNPLSCPMKQIILRAPTIQFFMQRPPNSSMAFACSSRRFSIKLAMFPSRASLRCSISPGLRQSGMTSVYLGTYERYAARCHAQTRQKGRSAARV